MERYQARFGESAKGYLTKVKDSPLKAAFQYALLNGGKRLRPTITMMVADALPEKQDVSLAALAIELFHTASLIADDLPCMDDDDERRNLPTLHKVFGEPLAILTSYAMISSGYDCVAVCAKRTGKDERLGLALENISENTGLSGACFGQLLDLAPPDHSIATLRQVIHKKTGTLFEIAFVLGWLFGGGDTEQLQKVKKAAYHFGGYFQMKDDQEDAKQDGGKGVNIWQALDENEVARLMEEEKLAYQQVLQELGMTHSPLYFLC